MRQISRRMEMIYPTIGWRRDEHGTHKHAHGSRMDSLTCITCSLENNAFSVLHYVMVALHYSMLHRFEIFSAPGTIAHGSIRLQPRVFARLLVGNYCYFLLDSFWVQQYFNNLRLFYSNKPMNFGIYDVFWKCSERKKDSWPTDNLYLHVVKHLRRFTQKVLFAGIVFTAIKVDTSTKYVDREKRCTKW